MHCISTKVVLGKLKQNGWVKVRMNGSHSIYKKNGVTVPVKVTCKEIPIGTLSSIERITGLSFS